MAGEGLRRSDVEGEEVPQVTGVEAQNNAAIRKDLRENPRDRFAAGALMYRSSDEELELLSGADWKNATGEANATFTMEDRQEAKAEFKKKWGFDVEEVIDLIYDERLLAAARAANDLRDGDNDEFREATAFKYMTTVGAIDTLLNNYSIDKVRAALDYHDATKGLARFPYKNGHEEADPDLDKDLRSYADVTARAARSVLQARQERRSNATQESGQIETAAV